MRRPIEGCVKTQPDTAVTSVKSKSGGVVVFTEARFGDEMRETSPRSLRQRQERSIVHFRRSRDQRR